MKEKKSTDNSIDTLLIEGTFYAPSGYSSSTREFTHHFIKMFRQDYKNVYLIDRQWDNIRTVLPKKYKDTIVKHMVGETKQITDVDPNKAMILRWGIPTAFDYTGFNDVFHRIKSIYFVWECDRLPPLWVDLLHYYDIIFTCSKSSKRAIVKSLEERDLHIPVEIIPHGVAKHYHKKEDIGRTLDGFTFLSVGTFQKRKAPMEMMEAFLREFREEEGNVRLIWKIGSVSDPSTLIVLKREIQKIAFKINKDMTSAPRIVLDMNTYEHEMLNTLYNEADAVIQVSHGEAWGLPILNAMATGTPAITLDKGGHRAFCNDKTTFFVKSKDELIYADGINDWYSKAHGVKWNDIDMDDYQKVLRDVYESSVERGKKGEAGLAIAKKFSWTNVARTAKKIFNKYDKQILNR